MLALSAWTWIIAAVLALGAITILISATIDLIRRLKDLNGSLRGASGQLNEILDEMRGDLETTSEGLATLRQRREEQESG